MYSITSVNDAVTSLNAVVLNAIDQAIPRGFIRNSKFPIGSRELYGITFKKKITFTDFLRRKIPTIFIINFPSIVS
jgi:hypothetical protein